MASKHLVTEHPSSQLAMAHAGNKRRSPLELAAQTASTSYARLLPPEVLREALLTGQMPDEFAPHIGTLLDESPVSLLAKVVEQLCAETAQPRERIWAVMQELGRQHRVMRDLQPREPDDAQAVSA